MRVLRSHPGELRAARALTRWRGLRHRSQVACVEVRRQRFRRRFRIREADVAVGSYEIDGIAPAGRPGRTPASTERRAAAVAFPAGRLDLGRGARRRRGPASRVTSAARSCRRRSQSVSPTATGRRRAPRRRVLRSGCSAVVASTVCETVRNIKRRVAANREHHRDHERARCSAGRAGRSRRRSSRR